MEHATYSRTLLWVLVLVRLSVGNVVDGILSRLSLLERRLSSVTQLIQRTPWIDSRAWHKVIVEATLIIQLAVIRGSLTVQLYFSCLSIYEYIQMYTLDCRIGMPRSAQYRASIITAQTSVIPTIS